MKSKKKLNLTGYSSEKKITSGKKSGRGRLKTKESREQTEDGVWFTMNQTWGLVTKTKRKTRD